MSSQMIYESACAIMSAHAKLPDTIVYDSETDWDDVNDCSDYFHNKCLADQPYNPDFLLHCECLSFFSVEAFVYFSPAFVAAAALGNIDDRDEVSIRIRMALKKKEFRSALPLAHYQLLNDFLLMFDAELTAFFESL